MERPKPLKDIDLKEVISLLEEQLDTAEEGNHGDDEPNENEDILSDYDYQIYEAIANAVYGEDKFFDYFNSLVT